jgi:hypothetical protein
MARGRSYEPINPREAFNVESPDSYMSQAAFLLCVGAAVGGKTRHVPRDDHFPLPPLQPMARRGPIRLERIVRRLDVSLDEYVSRRSPISSAMAAHLARELYEKPDPYTAAALVEAGLRSRHPVVQTAGAVAALDTTGAREDVIAVLEGSAKASDPDVRDLARTGLARAEPNHRLLHRYVGRRRIPRQRGERSNTAVISHGTWAANAQWWKPGGEFYKFLDAITPSLHLHDKSFGWSGDYSHAQRSLAASSTRLLCSQPRRYRRQSRYSTWSRSQLPRLFGIPRPRSVAASHHKGEKDHRHPSSLRRCYFGGRRRPKIARQH